MPAFAMSYDSRMTYYDVALDLKLGDFWLKGYSLFSLKRRIILNHLDNKYHLADRDLIAILGFFKGDSKTRSVDARDLSGVVEVGELQHSRSHHRSHEGNVQFLH